MSVLKKLVVPLGKVNGNKNRRARLAIRKSNFKLA